MGWEGADHGALYRLKHVRELNATGAADIDHLLHCVVEQRPKIRIVANIANRPPRERAQAADCGQPDCHDVRLGFCGRDLSSDSVGPAANSRKNPSHSDQ